jgi:LacI family transcriptional regulator
MDRHAPEVVLTTSMEAAEWAAAGVEIPREAAGVKVLLWDAREDLAGVLPGYERLGGAAVNLLAEQLQHDELGVPADPKVVLVEGRWHDGASLPGA